MQGFIPSLSRTTSLAADGFTPPGSHRRWLRAAIITLMLVLLVGAPRGVIGQETPSGQGAPPSELEEAEQLNKQVEKLHREGKYDDALPLAERALAIREKALGTEHLEVAGSLNNLGVLYRQKGDYVRAEPLYQRALAIREKALGADHPDVAESLNNLALLYATKGDYVRAEPLFQRSLAILEKSLGAEHLTVANSINNLAGLLDAKGDRVRAEPLFQRSLAIREKTLGPEHPLVAESLNNLAALYVAQGDHVRAEPLHQRALAIREKALGAEHPRVAESLNNLAVLYAAKGDYVRAEPLLRRALASLEKSLGAEHPTVAAFLHNLASLYEAKGDISQAVQLTARGNEIREHNLALILTTGSEDQKRLYMATLSRETDTTVSRHVRAAPHDPQAARLALTTVLRRKGRVLDALSDQIGALRGHLKSEDRALLEQLSAARSQLATLVFKGIGKTDPAQHRAAVAAVTTEIERLETAISASSAEFRAQSRAVTLESVQQALPEGAALVELVSYRPFNAKAQKRNERYGAAHYVAYILRRDGPPLWVELGEAALIDTAVDRLRATLINPARSDVRSAARELDERVMRPVRKLLGDTRQLLLSPDGALNFLPFSALLDEQERFLVERYAITYLTSGRDLLRMQVARESWGKPTIFANPSFGEPVTEQIASAAARAAAPRSRRRSVTVTRSLSETYFAPLGGTAQEARTIQTLFPEADLLTGAQATESALKKVAAPRVLHIATHGFFLQDMGTVAPGSAQLAARGTDASAKTENPLLRSGLALAGANLRGGTGDDGILTALEASGVNLWGTKLVVLSACDTGLGEVRNGEGVYGLRRAFVLAGAESLVMSLWPVSDYATRGLMVSYYRNLKRGLGRSEALRQVQLEMLRRNRRLHPFYWANFIQSGEWANLEGKR